MFRRTKPYPLPSSYQPFLVTGRNLALALLLPINDPGVVCAIFEFVGVQDRCSVCKDRPGLCARVAGGFDWICPDCWSTILQPAEPGCDYWLTELSEDNGLMFGYRILWMSLGGEQH
jgi:hypothetical protein